MTYSLLKVGSDAEVFLTQGETKAPIPVCGLVGGTKEEPLPVLGGNGFAVQEDNVMLEFNIPAAGNATEFSNNLATILSHLIKQMKEKDYDIAARSSMAFPTTALQSEQAKQFGCEPDFCVWTKSINQPPNMDYLVRHIKGWHELKKEGKELRSAGFHLHQSYLFDGETPQLEHIENFVKANDLFLGIPLALHDEHGINGVSRKTLYGQGGCFRPKPYGHEYRVLGSHILDYGPPMYEWIFRQIEKCVTFLNTHYDTLPTIWTNYGGVIMEMQTIHNYSPASHAELSKLFGVEFCPVPYKSN